MLHLCFVLNVSLPVVSLCKILTGGRLDMSSFSIKALQFECLQEHKLLRHDLHSCQQG